MSDRDADSIAAAIFNMLGRIAADIDACEEQQVRSPRSGGLRALP